MDERKEFKFLVIRMSSIGDILLTTPLIRALRSKYPHSQIDYIVKEQFFDCLAENPDIDKTYKFDTTKDNLRQFRKDIQNVNYDFIIDLHGNFRSLILRPGQKSARIYKFNKNLLQRFLLVKFGFNFYKNIRPVYLRYLDSIQNLKVYYDGQGLDFFLNGSVQKKIKNQLANNGFDFSKKAICIAPGASLKTKRWPADKFSTVASRLQTEHNVQILLLGGPLDRAISQQISQVCAQPVADFTGKLSILETASAMSFSHLVLTNDTGLMHLANALDKPTIALFGPTSKELGFSPLPELSTIVENLNLSCRPCTHIGSNRCPKKHFKCMLDISPETVFETVAAKLHTLS